MAPDWTSASLVIGFRERSDGMTMIVDVEMQEVLLEDTVRPSRNHDGGEFKSSAFDWRSYMSCLSLSPSRDGTQNRQSQASESGSVVHNRMIPQTNVLQDSSRVRPKWTLDRRTLLVRTSEQRSVLSG